jgi:hypothetical protein
MGGGGPAIPARPGRVRATLTGQLKTPVTIELHFQRWFQQSTV